MADKRVTVIVPAWNAEATIEESVRSVLNQSYHSLNLLVMDDGSTDKTAAILSRLAAEDSRLRFYTLPNGGPAAARNQALALLGPETDYVMFLDADDLLLPDAVEYALSGTAEGTDLVIFGYCIRQPDGRLRPYGEAGQLLNRDSLGGNLARLYQANLLNQVWGKLYAAALLKGLRFPDLRWGEDRLFLFDVLERAAQIRVLPGCRYCYVLHRGESLISRYCAEKFSVCCEADRRMETLCTELDADGDAVFRYMFAKSVFSCVTTLFSPSCRLSHREKRAELRRIAAHPRVRRRCRNCAGGVPVRLLCTLLRRGPAELNLMNFFLIARFGDRFPGLFLRLKHRK